MKMLTVLARLGAACTLALAAASCSSQPAAKPPVARSGAVPPTIIGMNAGAPSYWTPEWAFTDLVRNHGFIGPFKKVGPDPIRFNESGYPIGVPKDTELDMFLDSSPRGHPGTIDCSISPGWTAHSMFSGKYADKGNGRFTVTVAPPPAEYTQVKLAIHADVDNATLTKLSCRQDTSPAGSLFAPAFLDDMKPFRVIRFMDWMLTNNLPPQTWADRPRPTDFSVIKKGVSVEEMVALANMSGSDPWFTMPFDADEAYYRNFAIYVRDHLAPDRKAYVEFSNEVWNTSFQQARDAVTRGKLRYPGIDDRLAGDYYYADRVRDLMKVWSDVYVGQTKRIVRVASSQAVWMERAEDILKHKGTWRSVDALATAPYFTVGVQEFSGSGKPRVDQVLAKLAIKADEAIDFAVAAKSVADKYGLRFVAYEAGPDVIGYVPDASADADAVARDPRMYKVYSDYLDKWRRKVGGLIVLFDSVSASVYTHKAYTGQPLDEAPKMRAVVDFARQVN